MACPILRLETTFGKFRFPLLANSYAVLAIRYLFVIFCIYFLYVYLSPLALSFIFFVSPSMFSARGLTYTYILKIYLRVCHFSTTQVRLCCEKLISKDKETIWVIVPRMQPL